MSHQDRAICLLGCTGSIGINTLDVATQLGIPVHSLTANSQVDKLAELALKHGAQHAVIARPELFSDLKEKLEGSPCTPHAGPEALCAVAADPQAASVVTAIVGGAGLAPTIAAVDAGKRVCIANKEPLVMAGALIMDRARASGAEILPVDSEHSAIFQCLDGHRIEEVEKLIITGSGGPFRTRMDLTTVTQEDALNHPTWDMGPKITVDSSTLMNKALEVIEAHHLFAIDLDKIEVMIHPQSVIHSMVAYGDGSLMAQLGEPDMRTPIQYALCYPTHTKGPVALPDLIARGKLTFEAPDRQRFPLLDLGYTASRMGGVAPVVFNAANETAVDAFLNGRIHYTDIAEIVASQVAACEPGDDHDLDGIIAADAQTRQRTEEALT